VFPNLQLSTAKTFFTELEPKLASMNVPVWRDELYLNITVGCLRRKRKQAADPEDGGVAFECREVFRHFDEVWKGVPFRRL